MLPQYAMLVSVCHWDSAVCPTANYVSCCFGPHEPCRNTNEKLPKLFKNQRTFLSNKSAVAHEIGVIVSGTKKKHSPQRCFLQLSFCLLLVYVIYVYFMSAYLHVYFFIYIYIGVYIIKSIFIQIYIYISFCTYYVLYIARCSGRVLFSRSFPLLCLMAGYLWPNYISDFAISVSGTKGNHSTAQSLRAPYASKLVCHSPFATIYCKSSENSHMTYCGKYRKNLHMPFLLKVLAVPIRLFTEKDWINKRTKSTCYVINLKLRVVRQSRQNLQFDRVTHKAFLVVLVPHWGQRRKHCERSCDMGSYRIWSFDFYQVELAPRFLTKVVSEQPSQQGIDFQHPRSIHCHCWSLLSPNHEPTPDPPKFPVCTTSWTANDAVIHSRE